MNIASILSNTYIILVISFLLNFGVVFVVTHYFYYPKSLRRDYYFTFMLMSIATFLLLFSLNDVKLKSGIALGLFAIFSIMRFRTESMPVREMTYLFVLITTSVVNAMLGQAGGLTYESGIIVASDVLILIAVGISEALRTKMQKTMTKLICYDRIDLIKTDKMQELIDDLQKRTGLKIDSVEVGHIDFLKDSAMLRVHYYPDTPHTNSVDKMLKFPKANEETDDDD
ncbi:MAG: DUF4956 domain-containing protein [Proteobacteria bacterium]|jgi:hypothetical protein|nr:DUF4956 domain-containing protein [Pseudomonadota bacterium]